ncbi:hypothetical protein ES703_08230 [subsurface metagenome]
MQTQEIISELNSLTLRSFNKTTDEALIGAIRILKKLPKEPEKVMSHACWENFEKSGGEISGDVITVKGRCKFCDREMIEIYRWEITKDAETGKILSKM